MASPAIEFRKVSLGFGSDPRREPLLKNLDLAVVQGESVVLIGPSGHGKSSILKLMAGLLEPTGGEVLINGLEWRAMRGGERDRVVRQTGMLFQRKALFDSMTAFENVAFPLRETSHLSDATIESTVMNYLTAVGLEQARDLYPDEMSGGMQKRLGIARALALKPRTVFYDDPTAGLDPITSRRIIQLILRLKSEMQTTLVAVINDMNRAYQLADRICMVIDSGLIDCGSPEATKAHPDPRVRQFITGALSGPMAVLA